MMREATAIRRFAIGKLKVEVHPDNSSMGAAAARHGRDAICATARGGGDVGVVFAAATSQLSMLRVLVSDPGVPWNRVLGFHLDEYSGISAKHPASFRRFLRQNLCRHVGMKEFWEMDADNSDTGAVCREYAARLNSVRPTVALLGIGENGHIAFNDPPEADFADPRDVKVVQLDPVCREQQVAEGWFPSLDAVPERALTLTIPAVLRIPKLIIAVPGTRKARIARATLTMPISTDVPATILRTHPDATMYLDEDSASELQDLAG